MLAENLKKHKDEDCRKFTQLCIWTMSGVHNLLLRTDACTLILATLQLSGSCTVIDIAYDVTHRILNTKWNFNLAKNIIWLALLVLIIWYIGRAFLHHCVYLLVVSFCASTLSGLCSVRMQIHETRTRSSDDYERQCIQSGHSAAHKLRLVRLGVYKCCNARDINADYHGKGNNRGAGATAMV